MSSDSRKRGKNVSALSVCVFVCLGMCVLGARACPFVSAAARVCDSNGLKWGIRACKWSHLNLGPSPPLSQRTPYSLFRAPLWHQPYGGKALQGFGLKWCTVDCTKSSTSDLNNLSSLDISTANLRQASRALNTIHRAAWALSITFWRTVQYCGIPGTGYFQTAFAALQQLTISQHGSSSPDRLWLRILISLLAVSLPLRQSILNVLAAERATMSSVANHI